MRHLWHIVHGKLCLYSAKFTIVRAAAKHVKMATHVLISLSASWWILFFIFAYSAICASRYTERSTSSTKSYIMIKYLGQGRGWKLPPVYEDSRPVTSHSWAIANGALGNEPTQVACSRCSSSHLCSQIGNDRMIFAVLLPLQRASFLGGLSDLELQLAVGLLQAPHSLHVAGQAVVQLLQGKLFALDGHGSRIEPVGLVVCKVPAEVQAANSGNAGTAWDFTTIWHHTRKSVPFDNLGLHGQLVTEQKRPGQKCLAVESQAVGECWSLIYNRGRQNYLPPLLSYLYCIFTFHHFVQTLSKQDPRWYQDMKVCRQFHTVFMKSKITISIKWML